MDWRTRLKTRIYKRRAEKVADDLSSYIKVNSRVLDFGCGGGWVGSRLEEKKKIRLMGVDVLDNIKTNIKFRQYDGNKIPFNNKSFEVVYAVYVFHHIKEQEQLLRESIRVAKKRLIIFEDVYSNWLELQLVKMFDFGNKLIDKDMEMALNFRSEKDWIEVLKRLGGRRIMVRKIKPFWLKPTKHRLFIVDLS